MSAHVHETIICLGAEETSDSPSLLISQVGFYYSGFSEDANGL